LYFGSALVPLPGCVFVTPRAAPEIAVCRTMTSQSRVATDRLP
jgi:hypothetical protein